jgi:hypothetical protein
MPAIDMIIAWSFGDQGERRSVSRQNGQPKMCDIRLRERPHLDEPWNNPMICCAECR